MPTQPFALSPNVSSTPVNGSQGLSIGSQNPTPNPTSAQNLPMSITSAVPQTQAPPAGFSAPNFITTARQQGIPDDQIYQYLSSKGLIGQSGAAQSGPVASTGGPVKNYLRYLGSGAIEQQIEGMAKGVASTVTGLESLGQNALQTITNPIVKGITGQAPVQTKTANQDFGKALAPTNAGQKVGDVLESVAELAAPTDAISAGKDIMEGVGDAAKLPELAEQGGKVAKTIAYTADKVLKALPEAATGTAYGLAHNQTVKQALETGGIFGVLSAGGEAVGDVWNAVKGDVNKNVTKALGITGKMSPTQAVEKVPQAVRALTIMSNLADDITVKTVDGVEKAWEPTKDGFYEGMQALQQTKQKIYDAYSGLAQKAGDAGAAFTESDFGKLASSIKSAAKDATAPFKSKADSLVSDIIQNFGSKDADGNLTFKDTSLSRIQSFLEKINTDVNPMSDKAAAEVSGTASSKIRELLDSKIENATGEGYQDLRNSYSDMKSIENDMVNQFKKSARKIGGGFGGYIEGYGTLDTILGALSHNPLEAAKGVGLGIFGKTMQYLKDPENALRSVFQQISPEEVDALKNRLVGTPDATPKANVPDIPTDKYTSPPKPPKPTPAALPSGEGVTPSANTVNVSPINLPAKVPSTVDAQDINTTQYSKNFKAGNPLFSKSGISDRGVQNLAQQASDLTKANGDVTISLKGDIPTDGYSVATSKDTEKSIPQEDFEKDPVSATKQYIKDNLTQLKKSGVNLGTWIDNGKVYFDVPSVFTDKTAAVKAAQKADQLGIFDLKNFETIGKDQYEKIISDDEAGTGGNSGPVRGTSSSSDEGQGSNGQNGKADSPGGTKAKGASASSQKLESEIQAAQKEYKARLKKAAAK